MRAIGTPTVLRKGKEMLRYIFDVENPVFQAIYTIGKIFALNFIWLLCSLPIITMGASTTALIYACTKLHDKEGYIWANFFSSFKENFKQSTVLFLLYLVVGIIIASDMVLGNQSGTGYGAAMKIGACILAVPYALSLLYVFAVQGKFVNTVKDTVRYSFFIAIQNFKYTLQMAILVVLLILANTTIILANYLTIVCGAGMLAYFCSAYYIRVFERYLPNSGDASGDPDAASQHLDLANIPTKEL